MRRGGERMSGAPEYKAEKTWGYVFNEETADWEQHDGILLRWRFLGEWRWRKKTVLCFDGQTPESLWPDIPIMVEKLAERARGGNTG